MRWPVLAILVLLSDQTPGVFDIVVTAPNGEVRTASSALIYDESNGAQFDLYFLTAASLFHNAETGRDDAAMVFVHVGGREIPIDPTEIFLSHSGPDAIAIVKATVAQTVATRQPLTFAEPPAGSSFEIVGHSCLGAPAIARGEVFGVVTECGSNRSATVVTLGVAEGFVKQIVPAFETVR